MNLELLQYVAVQMLFLSGIIDESLPAGSKVLPFTGTKSLIPSNVAVLLSESRARVDTLLCSAPNGAQGVTNDNQVLNTVSQVASLGSQAVDVLGNSKNIQQPAHGTVPSGTNPVAVAPAVSHPPSAVGSPAVQHVAQPVHHSRRKREISGIISETADSIGNAVQAIDDHPVASALLSGPGLTLTGHLANKVEDLTKPDTKTLGELILA